MPTPTNFPGCGGAAGHPWWGIAGRWWWTSTAGDTADGAGVRRAQQDPFVHAGESTLLQTENTSERDMFKL